MRELRVNKKLTQKELAKEFETTLQAISHWETGRHEPDLDMIRKIARFFEVTADYLLELSDF